MTMLSRFMEKTVYHLPFLGYNTNMEDKKALVFGGTSGIGKELAQLLKDEGCSVTVTGNSRQNKNALYAPADGIISMALENNSFGPELDQHISSCDILCLCYGPFVQKPLHETLPSDWEKVAMHDYALNGMLLSAALPHMMERRFGGTRTESVRVCRTNAAYAGAKTGLSVLVKSVGECYGNYNITCNGILPGYVTSVPQGKKAMSALTVAKEALRLIKSPTLNGLLLNVES